MASYSNSNNSYQTLRGYKHVWCYPREPVLRRIFKKRRFVWRYPYKNWYNDNVAFHSIVMLVMLCVFLSRVCWLPKRGPTWLHKSCFDCALMLIFGHPHHAPHPHHVDTQVTMVYIDSFWLSFNANNSPIWRKELNQSDTFSKQHSTGFAFTNTD